MNFSGNYIPKYTSPEERDFLSYLDDIKYENFIKDPDQSIRQTKIINFDIIHHQCRGTSCKTRRVTTKQFFKKIWKDIKIKIKNF